MSYYYAPVGNRSTYSNSRNNNILSPYKSYSSGTSGVSLDTLIGGVWSNVLYPSLKGLSKMIVPAGKATFNLFKPVITKAVKTSIPIAKRVTAWCAKTFKEKALPKIKEAVTQKGDFSVLGNTLVYYKSGDLPVILETYQITQISAFAFADCTASDLYLSAPTGCRLLLLPNAFSKCKVLRVHLDDSVYFTESSFVDSSCFLMIEGVNIYEKLKLCQEKNIYAEFRVWINNKYLLSATDEERIEAVKSFLGGTGADRFLAENPKNLFILKMGSSDSKTISKKKQGILGSVTSYRFLPNSYFKGTPELLKTRNQFLSILKKDKVPDNFTLSDLKSITYFKDEDLVLNSGEVYVDADYEEFSNFNFSVPETQVIQITKAVLSNIKRTIQEQQKKQRQRKEEYARSITDTQKIHIPKESIDNSTGTVIVPSNKLTDYSNYFEH